MIGHHVASMAAGAETFLRDIIWQLRLVEKDPATLSTPLGHVAEGVLNEEAIHCHIIADYLQTCLAEVLVLHSEVVLKSLVVIDWLRWLIRVKQSVVCSPEPEVVTHNIAGVHSHHSVHSHLSVHVGAPYAGKDI